MECVGQNSLVCLKIIGMERKVGGWIWAEAIRPAWWCTVAPLRLNPPKKFKWNNFTNFPIKFQKIYIISVFAIWFSSGKLMNDRKRKFCWNFHGKFCQTVAGISNRSIFWRVFANRPNSVWWWRRGVNGGGSSEVQQSVAPRERRFLLPFIVRVPCWVLNVARGSKRRHTGQQPTASVFQPPRRGVNGGGSLCRPFRKWSATASGRSVAALTWWCELVVANFLLQTGERLSPINIVFAKFIYYISSPPWRLLTY